MITKSKHLQVTQASVPQTSAAAEAPDTTVEPGVSVRGAAKRVLELLTSRTIVLIGAALLLIFYFQQRSGGLFVTSSNSSLLLRQTAVVAVVACGMAVLIIMGEIDLSVGSSAFFTGLIAAKCQVAGWGVVPSILAGIGVGIVLGLVQGLVITWFQVPAFIVTLAGFLIWRGLGLLWVNAIPIGPVTNNFIDVTEGRMSDAMVYVLAAAVVAYGAWQLFTARRHSSAGSIVGSVVRLAAYAVLAGLVVWVGRTSSGLPNAVLWITGVALALGIVLGRAKLGRRIFLLGSNREAALYAGINARGQVLIGFIIMGAIYGIAGTMLTARAGVAGPDAGTSLELVAIAAAVIGGTSLRGGIGSIRGALLGAFLLETIDNGMSLLGVSGYAQNVVKGVILVIAVALDGFFRRRQLAR